MQILTVAFLGPDGSGKSTVIHGLAERLNSASRVVRTFHLRPHWGRRSSGAVVTRPHAAPPRGVLRSIAQLMWWLVDYWVGHVLIRVRRLGNETVVLYDRYIHDVLVDPTRYRYSGPEWFTRWAVSLAPEPDLTIIFTAPAAVLRERKVEVSLEETVRQVADYAALAKRIERSHLIEALGQVHQVADIVESMILARLSSPSWSQR